MGTAPSRLNPQCSEVYSFPRSTKVLVGSQLRSSAWEKGGWMVLKLCTCIKSEVALTHSFLIQRLLVFTKSSHCLYEIASVTMVLLWHWPARLGYQRFHAGCQFFLSRRSLEPPDPDIHVVAPAPQAFFALVSSIYVFRNSPSVGRLLVVVLVGKRTRGIQIQTR